MLVPQCHHHRHSPLPFPPRTLAPPPSPFHASPFFRNPRASTSLQPRFFASRSEAVPQSAIQRIAEKLRSLGFKEDDDGGGGGGGPVPKSSPSSAGEIFVPLPKRLPKHRVGHTIDTSWSTPENPVPEPGSGGFVERYGELRRKARKERELEREKRRREEKAAVAPTLAELRLPEEELRRLRGVGVKLKKRLKIGKAGITEGIVNGIHERWRTAEVVKITCEDLCRMNMKRTHDLLEGLTGGTLLSRDREFIVLYRGKDYFPPAVSSAIEERRKGGIGMEKAAESRHGLTLTAFGAENADSDKQRRTPPSEEKKPVSVEGLIRTTGIKLSLALEKKAKAEKLLAELQNVENPEQPDVDKEGMRQEEMYMLRKARDDQGNDSTSMSTSNGADPSLLEIPSRQEDELTGFSVNNTYGDSGKTKPEMLDKSAHGDSQWSVSMQRHNEGDSGPGENLMTVELSKTAVPMGDNKRETSVELPMSWINLSNKERLILRKQALRTRKRPMLAIGRSNIVSGVAKKIEMHFQKHPLGHQSRSWFSSWSHTLLWLGSRCGIELFSQQREGSK